MGSICIQEISVARLAWFAVVLGGWYNQDNCEGFHECIGHSRCSKPLRIEDNDTPTGEMYYRTLCIHLPEHLIIQAHVLLQILYMWHVCVCVCVKITGYG